MTVPASPTALVGTWVSDSQIHVTWTNHDTGPAPYTSLTLQIRYLDGSTNTLSPWTTALTLSGGATSGNVTGLGPNRIYYFQIRANNSSGSSGWYASAPVYMTPAAPSTASTPSNFVSSGFFINVNWGRLNYADPAVTFDIQRSVNGGAFVDVQTGLSYTLATWQDTSPGVGTNQYQIRASAAGRHSTYTQTNTLTALAPPHAPTLLSPNAVSVDFNSPVVLTWQHNPGGDLAPQSHFSIRYSTDSGVTWTALVTNVASSASTYTTVPGVAFFNGFSYLWEVQTQGNTGAAFGPWSNAAFVIGDAIPVATLLAGHPATTTTTLPLDTQWTFSQDQGLPQAGWAGTLLDSMGNVLERQSGSDAGTVITWAYSILTGHTYTVSLTVQSSTGQTSNPVTATTTANLPPPAPVTCIATFQPCTGTVELDLLALAPVSGTLPVDHVVIQRRIDGGVWVTTIANLALPASGIMTSVLDTIPSTHGLNEYRVISVSSLPTYYINPTVSAPGTDGTDLDQGHWIFLNYGPGFSQVLRMHGDPMVNTATSRNVVVDPLLGRTLPVALFGAQLSKVYAISGSVAYENDCVAPTPDDCTLDSSPADYEDAGWYAGIVMHRDYKGRRVFGTLSAMGTSDGLPMGNSHSIFPHRRNIASVNYTVTMVDYTENVPSPDVASGMF